MTRAYAREDKGAEDILNSIKNKDQRLTLENWFKERQANNFKLVPTVSRLYSLRLFANSLDKPFQKATKEDIMNFFSKYSKIYYKKLVKSFYRWLYEGELPDSIKWIKIKKTIEETKPERKTLSDDERRAIIENMDNQRDKTIFQILNENPTRPKDICNLKIGDVSADQYGFEVTMGSKTPKGRRTIRLINSVPDLQLWLRNHIYKGQSDKPLFYQLSSNRFGQPIGWNALKIALKNSVKRAGIKKDISLYDFRRTVATELLTDPRFTNKEVQVMGGWSSIRMLDVYGKVTSEMVNKKKLMINGKLKEASKELKDKFKPIKCPRCEEDNSYDSDFCQKCWLPLSRRAYKDIEKKKKISKMVWDKVAKGEKITFSKEIIKETIKDMIKSGEITI